MTSRHVNARLNDLNDPLSKLLNGCEPPADNGKEAFFGEYLLKIVTSPKVVTAPPMGKYLWRCKDGDREVHVTSCLGVGSDGRVYVQIENSATGIPYDECVKVSE